MEGNDSGSSGSLEFDSPALSNRIWVTIINLMEASAGLDIFVIL